MTVRELARIAGVSASTVSRYFTGAENVSPENAGKIEAVLAQEDGVPKRQNSRNRLLLVVAPAKKSMYYSELIDLFIRQSAEYGMQLLILPIQSLNGPQNILSQVRPGGVILFEEDEAGIIYDYVTKKHIPLVLCGEDTLSTKESIYIHVNDVLAAYQATKYLLELGHRDILFLSNYGRGVNACFQRLNGCRKALEEAGIAWDEGRVSYGALTRENGYRFVQERIRDRQNFSAVFAFSDEMACGVLAGLHDLGIRVPEEISVLGFDDVPAAEQTRPRITTIHQPLDDIVKITLEFFKTDLESFSISREIVVPHQLIERDSCCRKV